MASTSRCRLPQRLGSAGSSSVSPGETASVDPAETSFAMRFFSVSNEDTMTLLFLMNPWRRIMQDNLDIFYNLYIIEDNRRYRIYAMNKITDLTLTILLALVGCQNPAGSTPAATTTTSTAVAVSAPSSVALFTPATITVTVTTTTTTSKSVSSGSAVVLNITGGGII